jgi:16S rRNA (guanine(966)-N(2))-methyltransferase RsmD
MRIITGTLKGRRFSIPKGLDVRPTTDRTKESMFNKIEAFKYIEGSNILDLFGGSGNLSFEAISRGASHVTCVEMDPANVKHIERTAAEFEVENRIRTVVSDVRNFLELPHNGYDIIFCDPPYNYEWMEQMIAVILENNWLNEDGWFMLEHDKYHNYKKHPHCFFSKAYGRTTVSIFLKHPVDSPKKPS